MNSIKAPGLANTCPGTPRDFPSFGQAAQRQQRLSRRHALTARASCSAFASLLGRLWTFAWRLTKDARHAERLVREAYKRAHDESNRCLTGESALHKMYAIIWSDWNGRGGIHSARVRAATRGSRFRLLKSYDANPSTSHGFSGIVDAVDALPDIQRVVLILIAVEGLSYSQAAEIVDSPVERVKRHLVDARLAIGLAMKSV
jgi:RNA polymerase sigma-70 factor (ECF subfamily)